MPLTNEVSQEFQFSSSFTYLYTAQLLQCSHINDACIQFLQLMGHLPGLNNYYVAKSIIPWYASR